MLGDTWLKLKLPMEKCNYICNPPQCIVLEYCHTVWSSLSFSHRLEKEGKLQQAMRCYREALADDPKEETAKTRLGLLTAALEKQVCRTTWSAWSVCIEGAGLVFSSM